jgi:hypothetical protein
MHRAIQASLLVTTVATVAACATQPPVVHPGNGPPLFVVPEASCRSDVGLGPTAGALPDSALCEDLVLDLKQALRDVGYKVVETPDDPHLANLRIVARQTPNSDPDHRGGAYLTIQVTVESVGEEIDRAVEDGDGSDQDGERSQIRAFARALATELAHSRRMRAAGLVPGS